MSELLKDLSKMEAFGGYLVDEKAVRVENIFLEFLKRFEFIFFLMLLLFTSFNYLSCGILMLSFLQL